MGARGRDKKQVERGFEEGSRTKETREKISCIPGGYNVPLLGAFYSEYVFFLIGVVQPRSVGNVAIVFIKDISLARSAPNRLGFTAPRAALAIIVAA